MAEQETNKKPIYKKWWFWVIIILVLLGIAGGSGDTNNTNNSQTTLTSGSETSSNNSTSNTTNDPAKKYSVGEIYEDGNVAIKFVALDENFKGYNQYATVKDGCKIIKAEFEFENLGTTDFLADSYSFNCYADGYDCESFWSVDDSTFSSTLSTGKKAKGSVYFQVPVDATSISLEYELNMWTSEKVEFSVK